MSGIVGIVNQPELAVDRSLLERMTAVLSLRGPDAQGVWTEGHVGFGHTLLRTVDDGPLEKQPFSLDGIVWITADARVDARPALINQLKTAGVAPVGDATDVELILRAYLAWGEDCTAHLMGDFAFAIWDGRAGRLLCVRDHLGGKPFFYATVPSGLIVSNTLACLRRHPGVSDDLNDQAIADFLLFGHNTEPDTTSFADIRRLPPAHLLEWTSGGLRTRRYWSMPVQEPLYFKDPAHYVDRFSELLDAAVADRLRTSRVSVLMSGGLDSSSIAAAAHGVLAKSGQPFDLRASTVVFDTVIQDEERHYAGLVGEALGIPIGYEVADRYKPFERRDHPLIRGPEPRSVASSARQIDRFTHLAEHGRVVLTGQGGDMILRPSASYLSSTLKRMEFSRFATDAWAHVRRHGRLPRLGLRTRLKALAGVKRKRRPFPEWIAPELVERLQLRERWAAFGQGPTDRVNHHRPEAYRIATSQWFRLFESLDPGVTGFPIEFRHPLFDLRLMEFSLRVPSMPWCVDKALVREAMRGKLPEAVRTRRKTPLAGNPLSTLMKDSGAEWLAQVPESPLLRRYVRRAAGPGMGKVSVEATEMPLDNEGALVEYFPSLYLNLWLNSL